MREPEVLKIEYCGYKKPSNLNENKFEILGLKNLIKKAEERISMLEQSSYLAEIAISYNNGNSLEEIFKNEKS